MLAVSIARRRKPFWRRTMIWRTKLAVSGWAVYFHGTHLAVAHQLIESSLLVGCQLAADLLPHRSQFRLHFRSDQRPDFLNSFLALVHRAFDALVLFGREVKAPVQLRAEVLPQHPRLHWLVASVSRTCWFEDSLNADRARHQTSDENHQCGQYDLPGAHQESASCSAAENIVESRSCSPSPLACNDQMLSAAARATQANALRQSALPQSVHASST